MAVTVTIVDDVSGHTETRVVQAGDYFIVTCEPCWLDGIQTYPKRGTHVLTVKGHNPQEPAAAHDHADQPTTT